MYRAIVLSLTLSTLVAQEPGEIESVGEEYLASIQNAERTATRKLAAIAKQYLEAGEPEKAREAYLALLRVSPFDIGARSYFVEAGEQAVLEEARTSVYDRA